MAWSCPKYLWKQLHTTERICWTANLVKLVLHTQAAHWPLAVVTAPGESGKCCKLHQKVDIKWACLAEAGHQFTQVHQTPLLTPPLLHIFSEKGLNKEAEKVLSSTFPIPPQCNQYMTQFLNYIVRPSNISDIPPCTTKAYSQGWKKAQEAMGSSASGIHFDHYMAGTFNPEIVVINATLANIPLCTGLSCWKKGINVMIKKTCGNFIVKKLMIILWFEADFNANDKWLGHMIMY